MKRWRCLERVAPAESGPGAAHGLQHPAPGLAPGGRSRRCSGFILETRSVLGLHPWAFALPAASTLSPASPPAVLSIHRVIRYYKLRPLPWCWRIPFFSVPPMCCRMRGCQLPSFGCSGCRSYGDRSGPGLGSSTALLFGPEPLFESTF